MKLYGSSGSVCVMFVNEEEFVLKVLMEAV